MLFNSLTFVLFFIVVYSLYLILTHRYQNYLLLGASWFFYACWDWRFLFLLLLSTAIDFAFGLALGHPSSQEQTGPVPLNQAPLNQESTQQTDARQTDARQRRRKAILIASVCINLGILGFFKYFNFFSSGLHRLLQAVHINADAPTLEILLPIGISFYTFHNMSYVIDVYRGIIRPTRSFINFALYTAFFPQLVAGPIARPAHLLPQVEQPRRITLWMLREGFWLILLGYFKKVVIADNMVPFTQPIFDNAHKASGIWILIGIYAFALQIYGDFSGYSDIARGLSKLMGFDLILNFKHPYLATNPRDFWSRWHISLSTWLRDYLYIPLGGNRHGQLQTYRNLFLTMLIGGLWHGAAWHFVAWGAYHGLLLVVQRKLETLPIFSSLTRGASSPLMASLRRWVSTLVFFHVTCLGWLLFAVRGLTDAPVLLVNMVTKFGTNPYLIDGKAAVASLLVFGGPVLLLECIEEKCDRLPIVPYWSRPVRLACYITVMVAIVLCGAVNRKEFIYFQF